MLFQLFIFYFGGRWLSDLGGRYFREVTHQQIAVLSLALLLVDDWSSVRSLPLVALLGISMRRKWGSSHFSSWHVLFFNLGDLKAILNFNLL